MSVPDHAAVQAAVFLALQGHAPLVSLLPDAEQGIGAYAPANGKFPYVVIESIASSPLSTQADTLDDCQVVCAVYSDQAGGAQARDVLAGVASALANPLAIEGQRVVLQQGGVAQVQLTGDGKTYRGAYALRVVIEKDEG